MLHRLFALGSCLVLIGISSSLLAASSGGGFTAPGYLPLDPPFVLNLSAERRTRFMQIGVQVYIEESAQADAVQFHMPAVRNAMIMLLSGKTVEQASSVETREQWRSEALAELQALLQTLHGDPAIKELFFTDFIIQ